MAEAEGELGSVIADGPFVEAVSLSAGSPIALREAFCAANLETVDMKLAKAGAAVAEVGCQDIPDFLTWVSTPIFSDRAASLAVELGCDQEEFWPCKFQTNPDQKYFFHLPMKSFDIVDFEQSSFLMTLPGNPPIPMFIQDLKVKKIPKHFTPCFRVSIPHSREVLVELFVREDFKIAFESHNFTGGKFRMLA
jgi:hypothetical protein